MPGKEPSHPGSESGSRRGGARRGLEGLANLAFGSLSRVSGSTSDEHRASPRVADLELDLDDPAQRQFGAYELLERIGGGGMGVVYRARHVPLDREVAVKLLSAGPWAAPDVIERFEREAQNSARMQHPNIITVYEAGSFDGLQFFSMRLVRGESLAAKLARGETLEPMAAASMMRIVAEAMDYAHSLGILHLDLKPANVLIDEAGVPYVSDFGLARRLEHALAVDNNEVSGTPAYMAPEQAEVRAQKLTAATDIWGLGALLYVMLTGSPPFRAATAQDTVKLVLQGRVRAPRRWRPQLPLDLQAVVLRCLRRNPDARYQSARALADDLACFVEGRPVQARPLNTAQRVTRWARREPKLATLALLAFGLLVAGLAVSTTQWQRAEAGANLARESLWATRAQSAQNALAEGDGFRGLRPLVANLAGMERAHRSIDASIERQRVGAILANAPQLVDLVRLPAGEHAISIAIAPDGRHFAVATAHDEWGGLPHHVRQYELDGLQETWSVAIDQRTLPLPAGATAAAFSELRYTADGRHLLAGANAQPAVPAPRGSDMLAFDVRAGRVLWPAGLPRQRADVVYDDDAHYALVRSRSNPSLRWPDSAQFYTVDGWKPIGPRHASASTLAAQLWLPSPNGEVWLGTPDSAHFTLYDVPSLQPRWRLQVPPASLVRAWQFSHSGRRLALGSVDGAVRIVDVADGRVVELRSEPTARVLRVEFSDDDRTLAAVDENGQLWAWDVATGAPRTAPLHFVRGGAKAALLRFAGNTLFGSGRLDNGNAELGYVTLTPRAAFNNTAVPGAVRLHTTTAFGTAFDVSTTVRRLVMGGGAGLVEVWRLPPLPLRMARAAPLPPDALSFDGTRLVAVDGDTVQVVGAVAGQPRSPPLQHPEPVRFAELSPDGSTLATVAGRTVRSIDTHTWRLRDAPVVLPQTPLHAAFAQSAPLLVLTTSDYRRGVLSEQKRLIDTSQGEPRNVVSVDALTDFAMDANGRYALVASWNSANHVETGPRRIELDSGTVSCAPKLGEWWSFTLAPDGGSAWFETSSPAGIGLQRWDLDACRQIAAVAPPAVQAGAVLQAQGDGLAVRRDGRWALILIDANGSREAALGEAIPDAMYAFALSADGARAAFATQNAVHLLDAWYGHSLSAPLSAPIAGDDAIAQLAFSPDGTRLLARTINHRWLVWQLPRTQLGIPALARLVRILDPDPAQPMTDADVAALRADLRAVTPAVPAAAPVSAVPVVFTPAPDAGVDPRFVPLDLSQAINVPLVGAVWPEFGVRGDRPTLAPGPQRFLGIDYRVEGGVQLKGAGTAPASGPALRRSAEIAVPDVVARRVHVLAFMHTPLDRGAPSRPFARVVLTRADGRETALEIRTLRDVVTDVSPNLAAPSARIAWAGVSSEFVRGGGSVARPTSDAYAVTLEVPPGTGPIRGLRFEAVDGALEAPLFYAATLEREPAGPKPHARGQTAVTAVSSTVAESEVSQ